MLHTDTKSRLTIRIEDSLPACRDLWQKMMPSVLISDDWEFRYCFARHYRNQPAFITAEENGVIIGLLPLCRIHGTDVHGFFPGETWHGKTWIEPNRIIARDIGVLQQMLEWMNARQISYHLRYILAELERDETVLHEDEVGYLFYPSDHNFEMESFYQSFHSRKSLKSIRKDIQSFDNRGLVWRLNQLDDFEIMIQMNQEAFGANSYFSDPNFVKSFRDLLKYFQQQNILTLVTAEIEGKAAAVDFGCVYKNRCTWLAGGVNPEFRGIAKAINIRHLKTACEQKLDSVDFLCGDFSWKTIFQLSPRPLYEVTNIKTAH